MEPFDWYPYPPESMLFCNDAKELDAFADYLNGDM